MTTPIEQQPIEEVSPYGYRLAGGRPPFVPLTGKEPLQAAFDEVDADPDSFAVSGQPVGPEMWRRVLEASATPEGRAMLRALLRLDEGTPREFVYEGVVGFQSDGSGNARASMFDVPQGARAFLTRALVEVGGQQPGSAVIANAWLGIFETPGGDQVSGGTTATYGPGQLRAFAPQNASTGLFLPQLIVDQDDTAWGFRSGMRAVAVIAGAAGIATKQATIAFRFNVRFDQAVV